MKLLCALISVALVSALAAGCGSGGDDETTMAVLAKKTFVKRGNAICDEYGRKRDRAMEMALKEEKGPQKFETVYVEDVLPIISRMTEDLEDLGEPDRGAETVAAIIASFREGIETLEADATTNSKVSPFEVAKVKAVAYGLEACADF